METHRALSLAHQHRARIEQHIAAAVEMMREDPCRVRMPLARARWGLVQLLREYHLFKAIEIFDPAIRSGSLVKAQRAALLRDTCARGWQRYCDYAIEWSGRDVADRWDEYRPAMLGMAGALREHMVREERQITELLSSAKRTRRLAT